MASSQGLIAVLLLLALALAEGALQCRKCDRVGTSNDCHEIVTCTSNEECYMDEIITSAGILYEGGCRSRELCTNGRRRSSSVELFNQTPRLKRQDEELISCSRCCNNDTFICNSRLCGIRKLLDVKDVVECYECNEVADFNQCNYVKTCAADEVCKSAIYSLHNGDLRYSFGCSRVHPCVDGTGLLIKGGFSVGKRQQHQQHTGTEICQICCGDNLCNTGPCGDLAKKLKKLYDHGNLDLSTLSVI